MRKIQLQAQNDELRARVAELEGSDVGSMAKANFELKGELDKLQAKFQEVSQELEARKAESAEKETKTDEVKEEDEKDVDGHEEPSV